MSATYLQKLKPTSLPWFIKRNSVAECTFDCNSVKSQPISIIFALQKPENNVQNTACI